MRGTANSGSLPAFHVLVACHEMPWSFRIFRSVSRLMSAIWLMRNTSRSFDRLQVENGHPRSRGQHRAI